MFAAIFKGDKYCWYTCCSVWCWWQGTVRLMIYTCFSVKQVWAIPISHVGEWYMRLSFKIYSNKPKVSHPRSDTTNHFSQNQESEKPGRFQTNCGYHHPPHHQLPPCYYVATSVFSMLPRWQLWRKRSGIFHRAEHRAVAAGISSLWRWEWAHLRSEFLEQPKPIGLMGLVYLPTCMVHFYGKGR